MLQSEDKSELLLEMQGIDKSFPGVQALRDVSLSLRPGEVLGIVGENGAGKSTLIKILGGAHLPDRGRIVLEGREVSFRSPSAAQQAGISIIYQEFNLVPDLTVRENIFLGASELAAASFGRPGSSKRLGSSSRSSAWRSIRQLRCRELTVAQQQTVEIAKALSVNARIVVMDEPTAALTAQEVQHLFVVIAELKKQGLGIIYISHRLDEIFCRGRPSDDLARRTACGHRPGGSVVSPASDRDDGRPSLESEFPKQVTPRGRERLRVEDLSRGNFVRQVSFSRVCRRGPGVRRAGRSRPHRDHAARVRCRPARCRSDLRRWPARRDSPSAGCDPPPHLPADRRSKSSGTDSQALRATQLRPAESGSPGRGPFLDQRQERSELSRYIDELKIRVTSQEQLAVTLSGGNQQKVVLAKWLAKNADIIIFDEPTRGIDVGAKYELYLLMNRLAAAGKAIIMISSELPEVLGMSDRILVMHEGRIKGEVTDVASASQEDLLSLAYA